MYKLVNGPLWAALNHRIGIRVVKAQREYIFFTIFIQTYSGLQVSLNSLLFFLCVGNRLKKKLFSTYSFFFFIQRFSLAKFPQHVTFTLHIYKLLFLVPSLFQNYKAMKAHCSQSLL